MVKSLGCWHLLALLFGILNLKFSKLQKICRSAIMQALFFFVYAWYSTNSFGLTGKGAGVAKRNGLLNRGGLKNPTRVRIPPLPKLNEVKLRKRNMRAGAARVRIRKSQRDGARRGRKIFQQKNICDRIPPLPNANLKAHIERAML